MEAIAKYLKHYAEPEQHLANSLITRSERCHRAALILPAFDESFDPIRRSLHRAAEADALLIAVINCPDNATRDQIQRTRRLLETLTQHHSCHLLVVDRVNTPIPKRQGVGLARKIGTDIALALFAAGRLTSPWIYNTDADASLPENYFHHALGSRGAAVFAHRHHTADSNLARAIALYDLHMAYYVAGLEFAKSSYAMPTLGSALAIHATTYAQIRGFPRRNAAEDFYLLNKAVKLAPVDYHRAVVIDIEARLSQRVPFGTGPALIKIVQQLDTDQTYESYRFEVFVHLRDTLAALNHFAETGELILREPNLSILHSLGFADRQENFVSAYPPRQRRKAVNDWFDGLRTLKFVRALGNHLPQAPLLQTLDTLPMEVRACMQSHYFGDANLN